MQRSQSLVEGVSDELSLSPLKDGRYVLIFQEEPAAVPATLPQADTGADALIAAGNAFKIPTGFVQKLCAVLHSMRTILLLLLLTASCTIRAQENYEIQVYASPTVQKGSTMVELHSNYTFNGEKTVENKVLPTNHVLHETIEITHGWNSWFETGLYFFNTIGNDHRTTYVGSHIRPRVMIPASWNWPVGVSLSMEAGYQKREYSEDDWSLEIRPIVDKQWDKFYLSFNPTFDKSFHGINKNQGYVFSPNFKASYNITKIMAGGFEYYGSLGTLNHIQPYQMQQEQLFAAVDLDWSPEWELNFGFGWGLTRSTDNEIFKLILGYRFHK